jgi:phenylalanine-4-hydroxylase
VLRGQRSEGVDGPLSCGLQALTRRRSFRAEAAPAPAAPGTPLCRSRQATGAGNALPIIIPRSIADVSNGRLLGFGEDLAEDHPGFLDPEYKRRRAQICGLARSHALGAPIPRLAYTPAERAVWAAALAQLEPLFQRHACAAFRAAYPRFAFSPAAVPQLQDLHTTLRAATGWAVRPTAGLLHPRDFLAGLAFRTFHSTQYLRHGSRPEYTPEPDLIHEALGHMPMLANPAFCDLAQAIGAASLGADDATVWHLTKCYWFCVEFGVVREGGGIAAFGAGILSSFGELQHMASGAAALTPFDPFQPLPKMSYKDGFQRCYFVLDSFEAGAARLREYCARVQRGLPEDVRRAVAEVMEAQAQA